MAEACHGVDYVLHQAAIPSVPRSVANPAESNRANVDGTLSLLIAARDAKVKRVVYASSSSLYGDTPTLPKHEEMLPSPISPYAVAKLTGEYYMTSFYRVYGLETVSLRAVPPTRGDAKFACHNAKSSTEETSPPSPCSGKLCSARIQPPPAAGK